MNLQDTQKLLYKIVPVSIFLITLGISPGISVDPINPVKLLILSTLGGISGGLILVNKNLFARNGIISRTIFGLTVAFVVALFSSFVQSELNWKEQFFGAYGRNTGLLTYINLVLVFLALIFFFSSTLLDRTIRALVIAGSLSTIYGFIQYLGLDPVAWGNAYNPIIGFLGNPNFQSSFIGISTVVLFDYVLRPNTKPIHKTICLLGIFINLFVVYQSDSQQGFLVFSLGILLVTLGFLHRCKSKIYYWGLIAVSTISAIVSLLGFLQKGPLSAFLYQPSVTFRGDYWRAGLRMFYENPISGLGLDAYGSYYRAYRDIEAISRRGPEITSDAAHNVFIDFFASGGLVLGVSYLLIFIFTLWIFFRAARLNSDKQPHLILVFALWACYQLQSLISINQIGLATWGWVFMGLTIGQAIQIIQRGDDSFKAIKTKGRTADSQLSASTILGCFVCGILGFTLGVFPLNSSSAERAAIKSGNVEKVLQAAFKNPRDPGRMNNLAAILGNYGHPNEALKIAKRTSEEFPTSFIAWRIITQVGSATLEDKAIAIKKMKALDPLSPDLR